jgi:hypothetical protein
MRLNRPSLGLFLWVVLSSVLAACSGATAPVTSTPNPVQTFDVMVYGATPSGIMAAIQAARLSKSVMLIEPTSWLGGTVAGGLSDTDFGTWQVIGGITLEFFQNTSALEVPRGGWPIEAPINVVFTVEPHVAQQVFNSMLRQANVPYRLNSPLIGVTKSGATVSRVRLSDGSQYAAKVFIDSSYEGDLMAMSGVPYVVGREALSPLEPDAGVQAPTAVPVDPYNTPGDASSGLLFEVTSGPAAPVGSADNHLMAYNYRICLTDMATHAANAIPFSQMMPPNYSAQNYQGAQRLINSMVRTESTETIARVFFNPPNSDGVPHPYADGKFDMNGGGLAFSSDVVHLPDAYPDGNWTLRRQIAERIRGYDQGLLYFLGTDPGVPAAVQQFWNKYGVCRDEFADNNNFPTQLYIREGRRMQGAYLLTEADVLNKVRPPPADVIAWGGYTMDSHTHQNLNVDGKLFSEGSGHAWLGYGCTAPGVCIIQPGTPFPIPYRVLTPLASDAANLLVSVTISATSMAYHAVRLEPQYMMMGQAAGAAASLAIDGQIAVQDVTYAQLQKLLVSPSAAGQPSLGLVPPCLLKGQLYPSATTLNMYEATSTPGSCSTQTFTCKNGSWQTPPGFSLLAYYPSCSAAQTSKLKRP